MSFIQNSLSGVQKEDVKTCGANVVASSHVPKAILPIIICTPPAILSTTHFLWRHFQTCAPIKLGNPLQRSLTLSDGRRKLAQI